MIASRLSTKWKMVTLADIAAPVQNAIADGPFGSNLKLDDYVPVGVPVLQGKNITDNTFRWFDVRFISSRKAEELKRSRVRIGDILIVKIGSIGYSAILHDLNGFDQAVIPANLAKVTPDLSKIDLQYLHSWLSSTTAKNYLVRAATRTAQPALSLKKIKDLPVPVPPLPEQRRIADILDKADVLRAKRRAALAQLDTLTQSIFIDMFGDPSANPKAWPVVSIADMCKVKGGKRLPKGEEYSPTPTPHRYIRVVDLKNGRVDEENLVFLKPEIQAQMARYVVNSGDVIMSIAGSIGLVAPVPATLDGVNLTENAAKLVPRRENEFEPEYLAAYLQSPHAQSQIRSHVGQVTIGKLALFRIEKIKLPVPELALQREFVLRSSALRKHKTVLRRHQLELEALLASLQSRAFQGKLW